MANTRDPYYVALGSTTFAVIQVDKDIYDADIAAALGLTKTDPADTATIIPMTQKTLLKTGKAAKVNATVFRDVTVGGETVTKTRQVPLICEIAKLGTAVKNLKGKTVRLGDGNVSWEISGVNVG